MRRYASSGHRLTSKVARASDGANTTVPGGVGWPKIEHLGGDGKGPPFDRDADVGHRITRD